MEVAVRVGVLNRMAALPRYYIQTSILGVLASQVRHDSCLQSPMIRGVLSPDLVGGW